jgi:transcriptional antiterminator RfaH
MYCGSGPGAQTDGRPWYLVRFKPNAHNRARTNLERQGAQVFLPMHRLASGVAQKAVTKPLFTGYLFAAFDPADLPFRTVNATFGVLHMVTRGYDLEQGLPTDLIDGLMHRCDETGILTPLQDLKEGDRVRILTGPFATFIAEIDHFDGAARAVMLLDLLGRQARASVDVKELERITD